MYKLIQPMYDDVCTNSNIENSINTIKGLEFKKLLSICFDQATYFSLTVAPWDSSIRTELEKELENFLVKKVHVQKWFCYDLSQTNRSLDIHIYKASLSTVNILLKYFNDIFLNEYENDSIENTTQTLEDLCVFTQTSLILGTVSHEYICHIYPSNNAFDQEVAASNKWKYSEDVKSEQIELIGINP